MHDSEENSFTIGKREDIDRILAAVATSAPHQLPLYRAAQMGMVNLIQVEREAAFPKRMVRKSQRPIVFLIGDDDYAGTGPDGWACARRLRQWGRGGIIHAAEGLHEHYRLAVGGAVWCGLFVFVDCGTAHENDWGQFLAPHMPVLHIKARTDLPHPIMPRRGETH